jgi:hypothetical protein
MTAPFIQFSKTDDLGELLERLRDVMARHPIAVQAAFAALAAEGRSFAETAEGAAWKERLVPSELFERVRLLWKSVGLYAFVERPTELLPSAFLEGAVRAASRGGLEALLSEIFDGARSE